MAMPWQQTQSPLANFAQNSLLNGGSQGRPYTQTVNGQAPGFGNLSVADFQNMGDHPITLGDMSDPGTLAAFYEGPKFSNLNNFSGSPYTSGLSSMINGLKYSGGSYAAKDMSKTALPEYDAMRSRLNSQYNSTQQQGQDAIDRQFAAMGGGPSGAQLKQTENLVGSIAKQRGEDMDQLNAQEAQARTGLQQREAEKEFQSGESARGYGFQADLAKPQLMTGLANLDLQFKNAQKEATNDEFNKLMAQFQAKHSGGLLGGGGFLGTGIGA